jgi:hypothetical protein
MATKKHFFSLRTSSIKDGSEVRFWKDKWLGTTSLREQYPALYNIVRHKGDTIAKILETSPPNMSFRRDLSWLVSWNALLLHLVNIQLQPVHDVFRWNVQENGKFSVASMYNVLIQPDLPIDKITNNRLWKLKLPLHIKVFGWYLRKGVILTKDKLAKRNWNRSRTYVFFHQDETIKHLFFQSCFAISLLSVIQVASTLFLPRNIANIFGNWLNGIDNRFKKHIRVAFIWSLWLCRNDKVFNDKKNLLFCRLCIGV